MMKLDSLRRFMTHPSQGYFASVITFHSYVNSWKDSSLGKEKYSRHRNEFGKAGFSVIYSNHSPNPRFHYHFLLMRWLEIKIVKAPSMLKKKTTQRKTQQFKFSLGSGEIGGWNKIIRREKTSDEIWVISPSCNEGKSSNLIL